MFAYDDQWLERHRDSRGIAYAMPPRREPFVYPGPANLPPFFVNLLPEGEVLSRLSRRTKLAKDDLFRFLALLGEDTVGDVWVTGGDGVRGIRLDLSSDTTFASAYAQLLSDNALDLPLDAVPGAQPKISASRVTLPVGTRAGPSAFLKLSLDPKYPRAAENEHFFMRMATACGFKAARTSLLFDADQVAALLVERFDRRSLQGAVHRLHQEDACQILDVFPADKYSLSLIQIGEGIRLSTSAPLVSLVEFLAQLAFGYLIGNHDQHAKNVSIVELADGSMGVSPVYDMLCTLVYGDQSLALPLHGKFGDLSRDDFLALGREFDLPEKAVARRLDHIVAKATPWLDRLLEIGLDRALLERLRGALAERAGALAG